MFGFKRKKKQDCQEELLAKMDGREIKYVTRRVRDADGNVKEMILNDPPLFKELEDKIKAVLDGKAASETFEAAASADAPEKIEKSVSVDISADDFDDEF